LYFNSFLGDGSQWGNGLHYKIQPSPAGLAQAFILAEDFLDGAPSAMVLGDNIFFGNGLSEVLAAVDSQPIAATVFAYHVSDLERYGVVYFDTDGNVKSVVEKPENPQLHYAVTGLFFVDETAPERPK
jgi:glucose-1-phosphate thymidylyltransferase